MTNSQRKLLVMISAISLAGYDYTSSHYVQRRMGKSITEDLSYLIDQGLVKRKIPGYLKLDMDENFLIYPTEDGLIELWTANDEQT